MIEEGDRSRDKDKEGKDKGTEGINKNKIEEAIWTTFSKIEKKEETTGDRWWTQSPIISGLLVI